LLTNLFSVASPVLLSGKHFTRI